MALAGLIPVLMPFLGDILNRVLGNPDKARELELALIKWAVDQDKGQLEVNKAEAQHRSIFVAGWRPFIGWVCGVAIAYEFVFHPLMSWGFAAMALPVPALPSLRQDGALWELVMGMLGLGGLRTFEKIKGVAVGSAAPKTSPGKGLGDATRGAR